MSDLSADFWLSMDHLLATSRVVIDRPKGQAHPRFAEMVYPVDYGYLEGTSAADGGGIDIFIGTRGIGSLQGLFCSVDLLKRDVEIKLVCGCSEEELGLIESFMNQQTMRVMRVTRKA